MKELRGWRWDCWAAMPLMGLALPGHHASCQTCIVTHESNGIDIITALILNDISPLCKYRMDLVLQLKVGPHGECACEACAQV